MAYIKDNKTTTKILNKMIRSIVEKTVSHGILNTMITCIVEKTVSHGRTEADSAFLSLV